MSEAVTVSPAKAAPTIHVESVQLDLLAPDQNQIRKHFDEAALQSLADSIRENGLIQPIVVRAAADGDRADYRIIAGERRYRAARLAGIEHVPVIVRDDLAGADITVIQVLENLQRENLSLSETCVGVNRLVAQLGFARTCEQLGKSATWVSKHAGVLDLPGELIALVSDGKIDSVDIARELGQLSQLDEDAYDGFIARYSAKSADLQVDLASQPEPTTLDEATEQEEVAYTQKNCQPPTRAEIRVKIAAARAEKLEEAEIAQRHAAPQARGTMEAQPATPGDEDETEADQHEAGTIPRVPHIAETAFDREKRQKRERLAALENEANNFAAEQLARLAQITPLPTADSQGSEGQPFFVSFESAPNWLLESEGGVDALTVKYRIKVRAPLSVSAPVLRALGTENDHTIDLDNLTLDQVQAIAQLLGRDIEIFTHRQLTGEQISKALSAAQARHAVRVEHSARLKAPPPSKTKLATKPGDVKAFLVATVVKAATNAHRIKAGDLHALYVTWCKKNKATPVPLNSNEWGDAIAAAGIGKIRSQGIKYTFVKLREVKG